MFGRKSPTIRHEIHVQGGHRPKATGLPPGPPPFGRSGMKPPPVASTKTVNVSAVPGVIVRVVGDVVSAGPDKGWQIAQMAERLFKERHESWHSEEDSGRIADACVRDAKRIVDSSYEGGS